jgi:hypothetical protein
MERRSFLWMLGLGGVGAAVPAAYGVDTAAVGKRNVGMRSFVCVCGKEYAFEMPSEVGTVQALACGCGLAVIYLP